MPQPQHRAVTEVELLVAELAESRRLIEYLVDHVRRLGDACIASQDPQTRAIGLDYRCAAVRRLGYDSATWASDMARRLEPVATLRRAGPPPQAKL